MGVSDAIVSGRKVVASSATAERLSTTQTNAKWVLIQPETDNTGVILVGGNSTLSHAATARTGIVLTALDSPVPFTVRDLRDLWLLCSVDGDGVTYVYMQKA
mgnify:CR=1 FL=1